jgi:hypothetical protein
VELIDSGRRTAYFFAQVKTTRGRGASIRASITSNEIRKIKSIPGPFYLIGIYLGAQTEGYMLAIDKFTRGPVNSIPKTFPIDEQNTRLLYDEVRRYWNACHKKNKVNKSHFSR